MDNLKQKMEKSLAVTKNKLNSIRTGRANPELLNRVQVDYYGSKMPLNQLASISVSEGNTFLINIFDAQSAEAIEKGILSSDLGLNPQREGNIIRIRLPELTQERRQSLVKVLMGEAEDAKVALRNIRRDHLNSLKREEDFNQDDLKAEQQSVQKVLDQYIESVDKLCKDKEEEILSS